MTAAWPADHVAYYVLFTRKDGWRATCSCHWQQPMEMVGPGWWQPITEKPTEDTA